MGLILGCNYHIFQSNCLKVSYEWGTQHFRKKQHQLNGSALSMLKIWALYALKQNIPAKS